MHTHAHTNTCTYIIHNRIRICVIIRLRLHLHLHLHWHALARTRRHVTLVPRMAYVHTTNAHSYTHVCALPPPPPPPPSAPLQDVLSSSSLRASVVHSRPKESFPETGFIYVFLITRTSQNESLPPHSCKTDQNCGSCDRPKCSWARIVVKMPSLNWLHGTG